MTKKKIVKFLSLMTVGVILNGALVFGAYATPDEWLQEEGRYMDFEEKSMQLSAEKELGQYVVRSGDTLISIASRFGFGESELADMNQISNPAFIREGQVLAIPGAVSIYTVRPGQTLSGIAKESGVSVAQLAAANGLRDEDFLETGKKLMIVKGLGQQSGTIPVSASRSLAQLSMDWPTVGWVSSPFGERDGKSHEGVDIAANLGEPIRASKKGKVVFAGPRGTYGLAVILDHGDGITTLYGHCSKVLVKEGQRVNAGDVIAKVGNTGRSTGPHLHMEVRLNGVPYDPLMCLKRMNA